jgi:undecaprenyl-diphosphatase
MNWIDRARELMGRADLVLLLAVGVIAVSGWVFLEIADEVSEHELGRIDTRAILMLREPGDPSDPIGPHWLEEAARDVTALGGYAVLTVLVASVVGFLLIGRHYSAALLILASTLGGLLISHLLKGFYSRPRPDLVPHLVQVSTESFPSGHAMLSAVVYLTLGALLARLVEAWWLRVYFVVVAVLLSLLIGLTRIYLGVHYPTDVVAGWAAGLGWAVLCWTVARYLQGRGVVEKGMG